MIDDNDILPLDGGEVADDLELKARMARAYASLPANDETTIARCVRVVLERAASENPVPAPRTGTRGRMIAGFGAVAAAVIVAFLIRDRLSDSGTAQPGDAGAVATTTPVAGGMQFALRLPKGGLAANVFVVGDFNGWDAKATPMIKDAKSGEWSARIVLLPGRHIYAYVVNGEKWIVDPLKPQIPDAGYGPANALVVEEEQK